MRRRTYLIGLAATSAALAGCADAGEEDDETEGDDATVDEEDDAEEETDDTEVDDSEADDDLDEETDDEGEDDAEEEAEGDDEGEGEDAEEVLEDEDQESAVEGLEILEHELIEGDFDDASVEGVVVNNTGDELSYVEVGVVAYNEDGQRIDDSFTNTSDLPDGEEWAFEVLLLEDYADIDDYTIAVTDSPF